MAAKQFPLSVVISAVDKLTKPLNDINRRLNATFKPVRQLQTGFAALAGASGITGAANAARGFHASIQSVNHEVSNLAGTMMRINIAAVTAGYVFNRSFIGTASMFENMEISLESIEGSAYKAAESMAWLKKISVDTPFGIEEMSKSYRLLRAYGMDAAQTRIAMKSITDQVAKVAGSGDDVSGIGIQLGQAFAKGKLQAQDMRIMAERGVPVWDYLRKAAERLNPQIKITNEQLLKMSEAGELGRDAIKQLIKQMGIESAGSADRFMKTWSGIIMQIKDQYQFFIDDLMRGSLGDMGPFAYLKKEAQEFLNTILKMKESGELRELAMDWGTKLLSGLRQLKEAAIGFWNVAQLIYGVVKQVKDALGGWDNLIYVIAGLMVTKLVVALAASIASFISLGATVASVGMRMTVVLVPALWRVVAAFAALAVANPLLTAIGLAIMAVIFIAKELYDNWDKVTAFFKSSLESMGAWIDKWLLKPLDKVISSIKSVGQYMPGFSSGAPALGQATGLGPATAIDPAGIPGAFGNSRAEVNVNFSNLPPGTSVRPGPNTGVPLNLDMGRMMMVP